MASKNFMQLGHNLVYRSNLFVFLKNIINTYFSSQNKKYKDSTLINTFYNLFQIKLHFG